MARTEHWEGPIAADVETKDPYLLGISLCSYSQDNAVYIPYYQYNKTTKQFDRQISIDLEDALYSWIIKQELIGHNFTYDKGWIDKTFAIDSQWISDTRIMWHLASAPAGPRPYGLKDAQKELLGWEEKGDKELDVNVRLYNGSLRRGDHYLADLPILAKYAALDAYSTMQVFKKLVPWFDQHDYWQMLNQMMDYSILLQKNTDLGIIVDTIGIEKAHKRLLTMKEAAKKRFLKELKNEISSLEHDWADRRIAGYKREYNKARYAAHPEEWERFNVNSDAHKRELFYEKLGNPVVNLTESKKPSVDGDTIKRFSGDYIGAYLKYEHANTISTSFSGPYIEHSRASGRLHPGFNICGTVSYRLSGFKPYLLNAPFDERGILRNMKCDDGYIGVHADLSAIEPTITAHYSEDKSLLKVFRDGLGDIYLDLALELFPNDKELQDGYCPNIPIKKEVKERFSKQRKVAKVIQLAVQYTGTGHTVSKNLIKDGIPTTVEEANGYVRAYWKKFRKVAEWNYQLKKVNEKERMLRNVIGRIIRVPDPEYKDLSNRFIQSSAHDCLIIWVLEIYRLCKERGVNIKPILLDCHDSTSNQVPANQVESLKSIYKEALDNINTLLSLCVTIKAEVKTFHSLAGLKGNE